MKTLLFLGLLAAAFVVWQKNSPAPPVPDRSSEESHGTAQDKGITGERLIIEYSTPAELLAKLKQIKTYQRLDLRDANSGRMSTGIRCTDTAAKAAYKDKAEAMIAEINAELHRISRLGLPPQ